MFKRRGLPLHRTVIAHTIDGRSFVGVLVGVYADSYVLRHAAMLPGEEAIVGDLVLPRENAAWFQADVPDALLPTSRAT